MDKFEKILDIIDHQEKYSDEEIREILQDEECRKLYQTMMEIDSALVKQETPAVDIDEEWDKFEHAHADELNGENNSENNGRNNGTSDGKWSSWRKMAASIAGFVLISGIAFAAIHTYIKKSQEPMLANESHTEMVANDSVKQVAVQDSLAKAKAEKPAVHKTFENVAFDKMMSEIATYYDMHVKFESAEAKSLRLYYEWDSHSSIESIVKELNQFENVNIEVVGQTIIVK